MPLDTIMSNDLWRDRGFTVPQGVSQMGNDATKTNPRDVLVDESKQADIENLGIAFAFSVGADCLLNSH